MSTTDDILDSGRKLQHHLRQLVDEAEAVTLEQELNEALDTAKDQPDNASNRVLNIAAKHDITREWLQTELTKRSGLPARSTSRGGFAPLPGKGNPVSPQRFKCPQCDRTWARRSAGQKIPSCPDHNVPFEPV